jgi:hypothetical protein
LHCAAGSWTWRVNVLLAVTEVGDVEVCDLRVFTAERCEVLREVWEAVSMVWSDAGLVRATPLADHEYAVMAP